MKTKAQMAEEIRVLTNALSRLVFAAQCREITMGDPCHLLAVKAELADAARAGDAVLKRDDK